MQGIPFCLSHLKMEGHLQTYTGIARHHTAS